MKCSITSLVLISFACLEGLAQREDYNWILGACTPQSDSTWSRIHWIFNDHFEYVEKRTYKVDHKMEYTNASISDSLGRLLLYTNGLTVFNKNYEIMPNGDGLNPGEVAISAKNSGYKLTGGAMILAWPENYNKYLIIHLTTDGIPFLWYSLNLLTTLVDMNLDEGKGDVVYKNRSVFADSIVNGSLAACRHANGRDWWIPCFYYSGKKCLMFLLDPSGVRLHHIQEIPFVFEPNGSGQAQFSPDGTKYSFLHRNSAGYREFFLSEFDRCSGMFFNPSYNTIPRFELVGVAFSPNSRFLYLSTGYELYQLDMSDQNAFDTRTRIDSIDGFQSFPLFPSYFSFMQLASDGKIYINNGRGPDYLSTIEKPDLKGKVCDVRQHNIHITSNATLPNFPYFRLGTKESSDCDTLAFNRLPVADWTSKLDGLEPLRYSFTDRSKYQAKEWNWNFGDPNSIDNISQQENPIHLFSAAGIYDVCLIVRNKNGEDTLCKTIDIRPTSLIDHQPSYEVVVSPNPCQDFLNLEITGFKNSKVNLYNPWGVKIHSQLLQPGKNALNMKTWDSGLYFYSVTKNGVQVKTGLVLKK